MDKWVSDDSIFISRSPGSSDGVAQVYELVSTNIPLGEDSFSFKGESTGPSTIAPLVQWPRKSYLRLLDFIQVNSLMVNASGYVILKSATKSRIVGRPDGATTYWRCLDMLPMQNYGLLKPRDIGIKPEFLITGGDVDELNITTENTDDVGEVGEWKRKYEKLDTEFKSLKSEFEELKARLALSDNTLIVCQGERQKVIKENERLQIRGDEMQVERKKASEERDKLTAEISNLERQLGESVPRSVMDENLKNAKDGCMVKFAESSIYYNYHGINYVSNKFVSMKSLGTSFLTYSTEKPMIGQTDTFGIEWNVYGDDQGMYCITAEPYKDTSQFVWNRDFIGWESSYNTTRLVFKAWKKT